MTSEVGSSIRNFDDSEVGTIFRIVDVGTHIRDLKIQTWAQALELLTSEVGTGIGIVDI